MDYKLKSLSEVLNVTKIANIHFFEFKENFSTKDDKHPFSELVFVCGGFLQVDSEDYTGNINKNEMIIHRANTFHSLNCPETVQPKVIIIGFECNSTELNFFSKKTVYLDDYSIKKLAGIVKEGRNVFLPPYNVPVYDMRTRKKQLFGSEQLLKNQLEYFLIELVREYRFNEKSDGGDEKNSLTINEIINYLNNNFLEKITIDELAFLFKTNRSTLCNIFKAQTGNTIIEYINYKKIDEAKRLILLRQNNFTEIAEKLKFESIHYFTRLFTKVVGYSPKQFLNKHNSLT